MAPPNNWNIRILVVDDEPFILTLAVRLLNNIGYNNIDTAESSAMALTKLIGNEKLYDVIMSDLKMPPMNGSDFMRWVQRSEFEGSIILFSGVDRSELENEFDLVKSFDLNVLGAISKPLQQEHLQKLLQDVVPSNSSVG